MLNFIAGISLLATGADHLAVLVRSVTVDWVKVSCVLHLGVFHCIVVVFAIVCLTYFVMLIC